MAFHRPFTEAHIAGWTRELDQRKPPAPQEPHQGMHEACAVAATNVASGIVLRLQTRAGPRLDIALNPVLAREIARIIAARGQEVGWLDAGMEVAIPNLPLDG